jgi:hypothetical protein
VAEKVLAVFVAVGLFTHQKSSVQLCVLSGKRFWFCFFRQFSFALFAPFAVNDFVFAVVFDFLITNYHY